ncbi:lipopolysaccharide biosynthesis protein [Arcticibacter eurypsychrophilus]|nr:polysaccharide biosynthesis C-terminal domain-containing protein [Arcticibacter eurypsychrophilus]
MSVSSRLISGTVAAWVQIGINLLTQLALVPIYLTYWRVETYGLWLAILSFAAILNSLDLGFQEYLGYEFLKIGREDLSKISEYLCSSIFIGVVLGIIQIVIMIGAVFWGILPHLLGERLTRINNTNTIYDAGIVLLLQGAAWLICGSIGGLLNRVLSVFGYYPRMAWWGIFASVLMNLTPAIAVMNGAGLLYTGIILAIVRVLSDVPIYVDMIRLLRKEGVKIVFPSLMLGWQIFVRSSVISVTNLFENFRQQGARLFLTPFVGAIGLAAFATMRTGANVAMQGLHTITNPLMPDLMRFLHQRDQVRSNIAFSTVWVVAIALMAPALIVLQAVFEPLYRAWTRGQIPFNHWLFALLSLGVLVYAISQPAISVVRGNNLLKQQITISSLTAGVVILGIVILVPLFGIMGAGMAILLAEIIACVAYSMVAKQWLSQHELIWPQRSFNRALISVWIAAISMSGMIWLPQYKWIIICISMLALFWNFWRYWHTLPVLATQHAMRLVINLPGVKFLFSNS